MSSREAAWALRQKYVPMGLRLALFYLTDFCGGDDWCARFRLPTYAQSCGVTDEKACEYLQRLQKRRLIGEIREDRETGLWQTVIRGSED